jgi:hypothetical protein
LADPARLAGDAQKRKRLEPIVTDCLRRDTTIVLGWKLVVLVFIWNGAGSQSAFGDMILTRKKA